MSQNRRQTFYALQLGLTHTLLGWIMACLQGIHPSTGYHTLSSL